MNITAFRNRLQIDTSERTGIVEVLNGGNPFFWNGSCVQFEIALFRKETLIDDLSNIAELRIELKDLTNLNGDALMSETLLGDDLNGDLTPEQWTAGGEDECHANVFFGSEVTDLDLGPGATAKDFWLVITAKRTDGQPITLGCSRITVAEDGSSVEASGVASGNFRYNAGFPELKFSDGTWHAFQPLIDEGQFLLDIEQTASSETADFTNNKTRFSEGYLELQFPDDSWHRLLATYDQGQYLWDIDQTASDSTDGDSSKFRVRLGYPEIKFLDLSWHRLKPIFDQGQYLLDTEQTASV